MIICDHLCSTLLNGTQPTVGLGLALAKGLIEQHGGELHAHSEGAGQGAEFTIRLPLTEAPSDVPPPSPRATPRSRRVLVIEDNADSAESLREALRWVGHEAEVAYSGPEGIQKARQFKPEIVLCDIGLPGMDGFEVARTMRADTELRSAHLVALTGYAQPEDRAKSKAAGFEQHLVKPPSMEKIEETLALAGL